jgi:branched-subunit amino acid transport protein
MTTLQLIIIVAALVTCALRTLPVLLLSRSEMPEIFRDWLGFVPAAILAAIVAAEVIYKPEWTPSGISLSLLAALAVTIAGAVTRSLFAMVIAGVAAFMALQAVLI